MWTDSLFKKIAESCKNGATIATFTAAGFVRRGLIAAGFTINKRKGYGKKREMLVGLGFTILFQSGMCARSPSAMAAARWVRGAPMSFAAMAEGGKTTTVWL